MVRLHSEGQNMEIIAWTEWFWTVRGIKPDGKRWESAHDHPTREGAEEEIEKWGPTMGVMKIMKRRYPIY